MYDHASPHNAHRIAKYAILSSCSYTTSQLPIIDEILKRVNYAEHRPHPFANEHHAISASSISPAQYISSGNTSTLYAVTHSRPGAHHRSSHAVNAVDALTPQHLHTHSRPGEHHRSSTQEDGLRNNALLSFPSFSARNQ